MKIKAGIKYKTRAGHIVGPLTHEGKVFTDPRVRVDMWSFLFHDTLLKYTGCGYLMPGLRMFDRDRAFQITEIYTEDYQI
jgi:hypothetical protein